MMSESYDSKRYNVKNRQNNYCWSGLLNSMFKMCMFKVCYMVSYQPSPKKPDF